MTHVHVRQVDLDTLFQHEHATVVYLALLDRAEQQLQLKTGLTLSELCRRVQLHSTQVESALQALATEGLIRLHPQQKRLEVVEEHVTTVIPFTTINTDEKKLKLAEAEIRRLTNEAKRSTINVESGIRLTTRNEERDLVIELEQTFGHGLTAVDAYWIGRMVSAFGPERVKQEFRKMRLARNPIKALVGALSNGSRGKAAQQREVEQVKITYPEL